MSGEYPSPKMEMKMSKTNDATSAPDDINKSNSNVLFVALIELIPKLLWPIIRLFLY